MKITQLIKNNIFLKFVICISLFTTLFVHQLSSQDTIAEGDYARAVGFMSNNLNNKKVFNLNLQANWFEDSKGMWYTTQSLEG